MSTMLLNKLLLFLDKPWSYITVDLIFNAPNVADLGFLRKVQVRSLSGGAFRGHLSKAFLLFTECQSVFNDTLEKVALEEILKLK